MSLQNFEFSGNELKQGGIDKDKKWKWRQEKEEKEVRAPAASGLYFPRHSDFIVATNEERALGVSMVTPYIEATMERIKGQEQEYILAWGETFSPHKFCWE